MENVLKTLSGKIKKEYKDFKSAMLTETAKYVYDNAFKINFFNEVYSFFIEDSEYLLDYFDFENSRYLMNNYRANIFKFISNTNVLPDLYEYYCGYDELPSLSYDTIAGMVVGMLLEKFE